MEVLRTPDERFSAIAGFPFAPRYMDLDLRVHFIDEGPRTAAPVLLLHGEPSWSFVYRRVIADLVRDGHRVVAPDLVGFGRSDKPARREVRTSTARDDPRCRPFPAGGSTGHAGAGRLGFHRGDAVTATFHTAKPAGRRRRLPEQLCEKRRVRVPPLARGPRR